jgi:hypothetical protein
MTSIHIRTRIEKDGEILLSGLPFHHGEEVEITVQTDQDRHVLTARELANSEIVGLWENRTDVPDSPEYARQLREQAQVRRSD